MGVNVSIRRMVARRPWIYWCVVAMIFAAALLSAHSWAQRVEHERESWGDVVDVLVATADIEPGAPFDGSVARFAYPAALVPVGAVAADDPDVASAISRQRLAPGEVITELDRAAADAPHALIQPGWLAAAVREAVPTGVDVGDRVVVTTEGIVLADDAIVVQSDGEIVLVATAERFAPAIAAAMANGDVALLVKP